ncbi:MAG TPA: hypothetical protein VFK06_17785 [Candidatus Angelobacter sp.]|nr:hypothetical protein [Candidatus Angelobacter sp.]
MPTALCSEFCFHVHITPAKDERPDLFTIGIQDGTVLRGICHVQPIEGAVAALRLTLEEAGRSVTVHTT